MPLMYLFGLRYAIFQRNDRAFTTSDSDVYREALFIVVERPFAKSIRADGETLSRRLLDYQNFQGRFKISAKQDDC